MLRKQLNKHRQIGMTKLEVEDLIAKRLLYTCTAMRYYYIELLSAPSTFEKSLEKLIGLQQARISRNRPGCFQRRFWSVSILSIRYWNYRGSICMSWFPINIWKAPCLVSAGSKFILRRRNTAFSQMKSAFYVVICSFQHPHFCTLDVVDF